MSNRKWKEDISRCQGCKTFDEVEVDGLCTMISHSSKCPCTTCLVKAMCGHGCDEYEDFFEYSHYVPRNVWEK